VARLAFLVASAVLVAACGASPSPASSARLRIAVYPQGAAGPVQRYRLRCSPPAGTVPDPTRACRTLASLAHPFAPTPAGTTCSDIAIGPQQAVVTGVDRGRRVHAVLRVSGSCEIDRWRRVAAVVPGFPRTS
jgi:Subtilisin inhibitor-like